MSLAQPFNACMTAWIDTEPNVNGTIKTFWEDFHVREISLDGTVGSLTELLTPQDARESQIKAMANESGEDWWTLSDEDFKERVNNVINNNLSTLTEVNRYSLERFLGVIHDVYNLSRSQSSASTVPVELQANKDEADDNNDDNHHQSGADDLTKTDTDKNEDSFRIGRIDRLLKKIHLNLLIEDDSKTVRTQFHKMLADNLPFVETKTVQLAEIQTIQNLDAAEAVYIPPQLLNRLKYDSDKSSSSRLEEGKYIQIILKAPCMAAIEGRSMSTYAIQQHKQRKRQKNISVEEQAAGSEPLTDYLHFNVLKMNRDSSEASSKIAKCLRRKPKFISFAGTKDRRGVTVQRMSAYKVTKSDLNAAVASLDWDRSIWISDLHYEAKRLKLGDLIGNNFTIVIRDVPIESISQLKRSCDSFRQNGFVNYFGLQRFGTKNIKTHEIGAALLNQKYGEAVRLILGDEVLGNQLRKQLGDKGDTDLECNDASFDESTTAHWYLDKENAQKALSLLSRHQYVESILLKFLSKEPKGFIPALQQLPRNSIGLYFHAAQSIIWNYVVSERIKRFGSVKPVIGDLVIPSTITSNVLTLDDTPMEDHQSDDSSDEDFLTDTTSDDQSNRPNLCPILIESEDQCSQYTIQDVVLPLPGDGVIYPSNMIDLYQFASLNLLGVPIDTFKTDNGHRLCEMHGSYRHMIGTVDNVSYEVLMDDECIPNRPILASDVDRLSEKPIHTTPAGFKLLAYALNSSQSNKNENEETNASTDNKMQSSTAIVLLTCSLKKSSYLTVALRELLCDKALQGSQQEGSVFKRTHDKTPQPGRSGFDRGKRRPYDRSSNFQRHRSDHQRGGSERFNKKPKNYRGSMNNPLE